MSDFTSGTILLYTEQATEIGYSTRWLGCRKWFFDNYKRNYRIDSVRLVIYGRLAANASPSRKNLAGTRTRGPRAPKHTFRLRSVTHINYNTSAGLISFDTFLDKQYKK